MLSKTSTLYCFSQLNQYSQYKTSAGIPTTFSLTDLSTDILSELNDIQYASRRHGTKNIYTQGCRGPLCRKKLRDTSSHRRAFQNCTPYSKPAERDTELILAQAFHDFLLDQLGRIYTVPAYIQHLPEYTDALVLFNEYLTG